MKLNSPLIKHLCLIGTMCLLTLMSLAQNGSDTDHDAYLFPVNPGVRNTLAGTMGELRSSHFHMGIDIRTGGVQGVPILAAADGFVSRVAVAAGGYGNAIYIQHPNGLSTVYAHLKEFSEPVNSFVRRAQYERQQFAVNLFPGRNEMMFSRGDTLGLSGNSGSSGGPHLHFEIRDENQNVVNPLIYNFEEIVDTRPPEIREIAFVSMSKDSRINGDYGRIELKPKPVRRGFYHLESPVKVRGKIGLELLAYDRQDWTRFRTGISKIIVKLDSQEVLNQSIDKLSFSRGRNFYQYIDYRSLRTSGRRFHKLYQDDGNELKFYNSLQDRGILTFDEECTHTLTIDLYDTYENHTRLEISLECVLVHVANHSSDREFVNRPDYEIDDHFLILMETPSSEEGNLRHSATFYISGMSHEVNANEVSGKILWDLKAGIPDSIGLGDRLINLPRYTKIPSGVAFEFYNEFLDARFASRSLFDTIYLRHTYSDTMFEDHEVFTFGEDLWPIRNRIDITLKPRNEYPDPGRSHVYQLDDRGNLLFAGGEWSENRISFRTRTFGDYTIAIDSVPPTIRPLIINHNELVFTIEDQLSGLKEFKVLVNGEWVLMNYDPKISRIWSEKLDESKPFEGPVVLEVVDNAGNIAIHQTNIIPNEAKGG